MLIRWHTTYTYTARKGKKELENKKSFRALLTLLEAFELESLFMLKLGGKTNLHFLNCSTQAQIANVFWKYTVCTKPVFSLLKAN